jgi:hypothetical protein
VHADDSLHEIKSSIWRYKGYCSVIVKSSQPDALVKFHVF